MLENMEISNIDEEKIEILLSIKKIVDNIVHVWKIAKTVEIEELGLLQLIKLANKENIGILLDMRYQVTKFVFLVLKNFNFEYYKEILKEIEKNE